MSGDQLVGIVFIALVMTLVVRRLMRLRLPAHRLIALGALWVGIFGLAFLIARHFN